MNEVRPKSPPAGHEERDAIVRDVARLARDAPKELTARVAALPLREQAEVVLRLPARERLELLLHAPQPMRLVRILPDSEVYFTVRDVGPYDALPLLALASADQLIHLIDLEAWRGDRFDPDRAGAWVALLLEAGEPTVVRFLRQADEELLALLFCRWIGVREIEDEDLPSIRGRGDSRAQEQEDEGFPSPDGQHRFFPSVRDHAPAILRIASILLQDEPNRYARVLRLAQWELPSELEESTLRWRQSRLDEHGFPDLEAALSVYAPPAGLTTRGGDAEPAPEDALRAPRTALRTQAVAPRIVAWLESLSGAILERVLFEMAAAANKILVADRADTGDPSAHRAAMERTVSFVGIALAARGATQAAEAARLLEEVPVLELFREGFARATALQSAARRLVREEWPRIHPRAMELLDPHIRGPVAALLERRPLVSDSESPGGRREFRSQGDIDAARDALDLAAAYGRAVAALGWDLHAMLESLPAGASPPTLGVLWMTSLARHESTGELRSGPISQALADSFRGRTDDARAREVSAGAFVDALRAAGSIDDAAARTLRHDTIERLAQLARDGSFALLIRDPR